MNRKRTLIIILLLFTSLFPLIPIPVAEASEATVSIQNSEDDVWMTEIGNIFGFESSVRMLDPEIGIRSFLRFEDVPLLKSSKINLATLYVYAGFDQGETISPGATVTIYGIDEPDCAPFSYSGQVWSLERPYTTASINWNVSDWHYSTWKSVNVTEIVREIINQYAWTQNNSIGFQILGASDTGYEYRTFEDIDHQHHGAYAYLYIQYDVAPGTPPGLPPASQWVETYQEWDIWAEEVFQESNMSVFWESGGLTPTYYHTTYARGEANGTDWDNITITGNYRAQSSSEDSICQVGDTTIILQDWGRVMLWYSEDAGATWSGFILNDQFVNLTTHTTDSRGGLAVDVNGTVHVTWGTFTPDSPATQRQVYSNFTVSANGVFNFYPGWTEFGNVYTDENMEADQYGRVAIVGVQSGEIRMQFRFMNGTWAGQEVIEDTDALDEPNVDMANQSWGDYPLMRFVYYRAWIGVDDIYQTIRDPDGTLHDTMLDSINCFDPTSAVDYANNMSWATWTDTPGGVTPRIVLRGYDFTTESLVSQEWVSSTVQQHTFSDIGIGGDGIGYIVWWSQWYPNHMGRRFYTNTSSPVTFIGTQTEIVSGGGAPNGIMGIVPWNVAGYVETQYFLVDENGTVVDTWTLEGENFTDVDDLKDFVDDVVNPQGGDPLDPDPGTQGWDTEGPFTRFKMRLYFLFIGLACVFTPLWAMAYKKFDAVGYTWCFLVMVLGVGLLWSITGI